MALIDFDPRDVSLFARGGHEAVFSRLRRQQALPVDIRGPVPVYSLVRYADIVRAYTQPEVYSPGAGLTLDSFDPLAPAGASKMLEMAPPGRHRALRAAMLGAFQGNSLAVLAEQSQSMIGAFLGSIEGHGTIEFVEGFACRVASATICQLLGLSQEETGRLAPSLRAVGTIDFGFSAKSMQHRRHIELWLLRELMKVIGDHRAAAESAGLIERLLDTELDEGSSLTDQEVALNCLNVALAGAGAIQHTLSGAVALWCEQDEHINDVVATPGLLHGFVEETLRWLTPVIHLTRVLSEKVEIMGQELPEGTGVCLWNISGNRDEDAFQEPGRFDPRRSPNRHLSFGVGPQYCLGAQLVRLQLRSLLAGMLRHGVRFQMSGDPRRMRSNAIAGIRSLLLVARRECAVELSVAEQPLPVKRAASNATHSS